MAKKGLFHIVEIVIISIVVFIMMSQVSSNIDRQPQWSRERLIMEGRDLLFSLDRMGVDWSDSARIQGFFNFSYNETGIRYRLELEGVPQDSISVGCLCDGGPSCTGFCDWLTNRLSGMGTFSINGLDVRFNLIRTPTINNLFDVIVTNMPLTGLDSDVANFLASGKGVILARDLAASDFTDYGTTLSEYFSVEQGTAGSGSVSFDLSEAGVQPTYYMIPKYFAVLPNLTGDRLDMSHDFAAFAGEAVRKKPGPYGKTIALTSSGTPACIAKYSASSSRGRSAWLSGSSLEDDWAVLLTSLIVWSSDQTRVVSGSEMGREVASVSINVLPGNPASEDYMFQPSQAVLTMGYLYD